jgi:hypothetical protein
MSTWKSLSALAITAVVVLLAGDVGRAQEVQSCPPGVFQENVKLPSGLERTLVALADRSPIFRAQCDKISSSPNLQVTVVIDPNIRSICRAFTVFRRRGLAVDANVHLPASGGVRLAELIGHEFEHILEQIEGLNLPALAKTRGSGVYQVEDLYETERAERVGRAVRDEAGKKVATARRAN